MRRFELKAGQGLSCAGLFASWVKKIERGALRLTTLGRDLRVATCACPTCSSIAALTAPRSHDLSECPPHREGSSQPRLAGLGRYQTKRSIGGYSPTSGILCVPHLRHVFLNPTLSGCPYRQIEGRSWESQKFGHNNVLSLGVSHSANRMLAGWKSFWKFIFLANVDVDAPAHPESL